MTLLNVYLFSVRTLLHVMELYITQQCVSIERPPRLKGSEPVMNSTIAALKELASLKVGVAFSISLPEIPEIEAVGSIPIGCNCFA